MDFRIEPNQRFGHGYQIRVIIGPACDIYDDEPLTYIDAIELIHEVADECFGGAIPSQIAVWPADSPDGAHGPDAVTYRPGPDGWEQVADGVNQPADPPDVPDGPGVIAFRPQPDVREAVADGEMQPVVSARSVILLAWTAWKKSGLEQSKAPCGDTAST